MSKLNPAEDSLANAYLEIGQLDDAIAELEERLMGAARWDTTVITQRCSMAIS